MFDWQETSPSFTPSFFFLITGCLFVWLALLTLLRSY